MESEFCSHCPHCVMAKRAKADAQRVEQQQQEEAQRQENEELRAMSEGKVYLRDYDRYNVEDLKNIFDINFLNDMREAITPAGQPSTDFEYELLCEMWRAIEARIVELKK